MKNIITVLFARPKTGPSIESSQGRTAEIIGDEYNLDPKTVIGYEKFAKGLDVLPETEGMSCFATPPCPIIG